MMLISEGVKRAAHTQITPQEKVFFKTRVLQTCQKNEFTLTKITESPGVFPPENALMKDENTARNRQESSCHCKISLCLI